MNYTPSHYQFSSGLPACLRETGALLSQRPSGNTNIQSSSSWFACDPFSGQKSIVQEEEVEDTSFNDMAQALNNESQEDDNLF